MLAALTQLRTYAAVPLIGVCNLKVKSFQSEKLKFQNFGKVFYDIVVNNYHDNMLFWLLQIKLFSLFLCLFIYLLFVHFN